MVTVDQAANNVHALKSQGSQFVASGLCQFMRRDPEPTNLTLRSTSSPEIFIMTSSLAAALQP